MRILHKKELGCQAKQAITLKEEDRDKSRKEVTFWELLGGKKAVKCELKPSPACLTPSLNLHTLVIFSKSPNPP